MRRLAPLLLCACNSILGIPEPSLTQANDHPDAPVKQPDAAIPDAPPPDAKVQVKLTITKDAAGGGKGTINTDLQAQTCDQNCPSLDITVDLGTGVNLEARPAPGSYFLGWSGACSGIKRFCSVTLDAAKTVTASFAANDHNIMFVSSTRVTGDFGGLAKGDKICNDAAMQAGLTGKFVAFLSQGSTNGRDRLVVPATTTPSRGFVRMDGKPVADTVADLTTNFRVWYPIVFDENGERVLSFTWTGSDQNGKVADNCQDWSSQSGMGFWGDPGSNANILGTFTQQCAAPAPLLCIQVDKTAPLAAPAPVDGKKIYVTSAQFSPGGGGLAAADNLCATEKPGGVTQVKALLPTTSTPASAVLKPDKLYVRPDGVPVGLGSEIGPTTMTTAPFVHGDGSYAPFVCCVLRAPGAIDAVPSGDKICTNWSSSSTSLVVSHTALSVINFWDPDDLFTAFNCSNSFLLVCVEQ